MSSKNSTPTSAERTSPSPGRCSMSGGRNQEIKRTAPVSNPSTVIKPPDTPASSRRALVGPCRSRVEAYAGMNEAESAPSPKNRLKRFGNIQASRNAPEAQLAPRARVMRLSRTKPKTRDKSVSAEIEVTSLSVRLNSQRPDGNGARDARR